MDFKHYAKELSHDKSSLSFPSALVPLMDFSSFFSKTQGHGQELML